MHWGHWEPGTTGGYQGAGDTGTGGHRGTGHTGDSGLAQS